MHWSPYVPVAERRRRSKKLADTLRKSGRETSPVEIEGLKIAKTFWGKAWCKHLEEHSDYSNRMPRGRTYCRNGSVIDLQVEAGCVTALVSGSSIYEVRIEIHSLAAKTWAVIKSQCTGQIASLVELLGGEISAEVMEVVTCAEKGLFPKSNEISLSCSCPDWAVMCKHVAAALYGIGARLDHSPELLFTLRGVDAEDLVEAVIEQSMPTPMPMSGEATAKTIELEDLSSVFGIDLDLEPAKVATRPEVMKLSAEKLELLRARTLRCLGELDGFLASVYDVSVSRGRIYLWWDSESHMARITPSKPGPVTLDVPSGKAWSLVKRGQLRTVLRALGEDDWEI